MSTVYSFGCSFSTPYMVDRERFWLHLLAGKLSADYKILGSGASEYHEAFHRLTFEMKKFKKNDLVIFQFTDHHRMGFSYNDFYFTTAILSRETSKETSDVIDLFMKTEKLDKTREDFATLYKFSDRWSDGQMFFHYWQVWNLLTYLKETVGIDFRILFLNQKWSEVIPENHYSHIPVFGKDNISLSAFIMDNNLHIGKDPEYNANPSDGHPGTLGHKAICDIIYNHLTEGDI